MSKWLLLLALPLSCVAGFLSSSVTHAVSVYDDAYHTTDSLYVNNGNISSGDCSEENFDITGFWQNYIQNEDWWAGSQDNKDKMLTFRSKFNHAKDVGNVAVSLEQRHYTSSGGYLTNEVTVQITEDKSMYLNWVDMGNPNLNPNHIVQPRSAIGSLSWGKISCSSGVNNNNPYFIVSGLDSAKNAELTFYNISNNAELTFNNSNIIKALNYFVDIEPENMNIPEGYDGEPIRKLDPDDSCQTDDCVVGGKWQPAFDIAWDDLDITLTDKTPLDKIDEYNIDKCYWEVHDGNWDDLNLTGEYPCDDHTPVEYTLPTYESYQVGLNYYDSENGILYSAEYLVNIDGGSGSDSINDPFYSSAIGRVFKKHMDSDYGLEKFFLAPINFVASLPSKVGNCSPINYTLMGENVQLNCLSTTVWDRPFLSGIVNFYQVILLATVTYFVAIGMYGVIKSATNPLDDKVEVLKL